MVCAFMVMRPLQMVKMAFPAKYPSHKQSFQKLPTLKMTISRELVVLWMRQNKQIKAHSIIFRMVSSYLPMWVIRMVEMAFPHKFYPRNRLSDACNTPMWIADRDNFLGSIFSDGRFHPFYYMPWMAMKPFITQKKNEWTFHFLFFRLRNCGRSRHSWRVFCQVDFFARPLRPFLWLKWP